MKELSVLLAFEWIKLKRSAGFRLLAAGFLLLGLYSIFFGYSEVSRQRENISELKIIETQTIEELKKSFPNMGPAGDIPYYFPRYAVNRPHSLAGLSIGQRDVNPYFLKLRILALEGQLYDSDTLNPLKVFNGNFDFSFFVIYVLPLLVIALSFGVYSEEKEQGTLSLIRMSGLSLNALVGGKLLLRGVIVLFMVALLLVFGTLLLNLPLNLELLVLTLGLFSYICFWFCLSYSVIIFKQGMSFNGLILLGVWLFFIIITPGIFNVFDQTERVGKEGIELTMKQRESVHSGWDQDKNVALDAFFKRYPQYSHQRPKTQDFSWSWYFANQEMGDVRAEKKVLAREEALKLQIERVQALEIFSPALSLQGLMNSLARSDLQGHLEFLQSARKFHKDFKEFFYPYLFADAKFPHEHYSLLPEQVVTEKINLATAQSALFKILLGALLFLGAGYVLSKRGMKEEAF